MKPLPSQFNLSHSVAESFRMGELIPFAVIETLPGDQFTLSSKAILRLAPLLSPTMHWVIVDVEFFYVPFRTVWPSFNAWLNGVKDAEPPFIEMKVNGPWRFGSVFDYLGYPIVPHGYEHNTPIKVLPFRLAAYAAVWNNFYRNPELQALRNDILFPGENDGPGRVYSSREGVDPNCFYPVSRPLPRNWSKDYLTSCHPHANERQDLLAAKSGIKHIGSYHGEFDIEEVLATAMDAEENIPIGYQAGRGVAKIQGHELSVHCPEHGLIMGLLSVVPEAVYTDGVDRSLIKFNRFEYGWPQLALSGDQPVYNKEILATHPDPDGEFGYLPIYSEYKYAKSRIAGSIREPDDHYHLARRFRAADPIGLNGGFVECRPSDRIFAVTTKDDDNVFAWVKNIINVKRFLPS